MIKRKLKVLIIEGSQKPPVFIQNLINGLLKEGLYVSLLGNDVKNQFIPANSKNFSRVITNYRNFNTIRILVSLIWIFITDIKAVIAARKYLSTDKGGKLKIKNWCTFSKMIHYNPDLLHFQWATHLAQYEKLIRAGEFKSVVSLRGRHINVSPVVDPTVAGLFRRVFPYLQGFHAVSQAIVREGAIYGVNPKRTQVIYSGLPPMPSPLDSKSISSSSLRLMAVGRFHWKKGYNYLLDAVAQLKAKHVPVRLTLIAQGEMPEEIQYQLYDLDLKNDVEWVKGVPHAVVLEQMKLHDIMILPSVEEGIANVVLEAMNMGLPVISTDCGGMDEAIENGVNGFLVPVRDSKAMADAILTFTRLNPAQLNSLRKHANETINQKFNGGKNIKAFEVLYREAMRCE